MNEPIPINDAPLNLENERIAEKMSQQFVKALWMQGLILKGMDITWLCADGSPAVGPEDVAVNFSVDLKFYVGDK